MADETPQLDWSPAIERLAAYKKQIESFAGQNGMNPFIWLREKGINKLQKRLDNTTSRTKELFNEIMALNLKDEPRVNLLDPALSLPEKRILKERKNK